MAIVAMTPLFVTTSLFVMTTIVKGSFRLCGRSKEEEEIHHDAEEQELPAGEEDFPDEEPPAKKQSKAWTFS
ncbi:hypothetical protein NDU88_005024 [Pleurodeles waltl]|uniref:Uncharacterized protein n=1 Tax=Pleurodeles waltl TaxID=8319 RepID=A0AAV7NMP9_PLEWA|nr:hypothetical protein NDU88_005024 [Pleurodeles waltl]